MAALLLLCRASARSCAMRALLLARRPFAFWRTHSSSCWSAFWRFDACFSSTARRRLLLLQPGRVVALERDALAAVELEDPARDVVEEVAVVRHGDDGAFVLLEVAFEPRHALGVEVVRGLVEQEHVGLLEEEAARAPRGGVSPPESTPTGVSAGGQRSASIAMLQLGVDVPRVEVVDLLLQLALLLHERVEVGVWLGEAGARRPRRPSAARRPRSRPPRRPRGRSSSGVELGLLRGGSRT